MTLKSRHIGENLVFTSEHDKRIVHAVGPGVWQYQLRPDHLGAATADPQGWTTTVVETGLGGNTEIDPNDEAGRVGTITTDNAENDGANMQLLGENAKFTSGQTIYARLVGKINDVDQTDLLFGFCITDTDLLGGMTDGVYFESVDGSASVSFVAEKDSTETQEDTLGTLTDDTDVTLEFFWDGPAGTIEAFIDGVSVYGPADPANLPDDESLRLSLHFLTGEATANTLNIKDLYACIINH